jgi:hypothetical protein
MATERLICVPSTSGFPVIYMMPLAFVGRTYRVECWGTRVNTVGESPDKGYVAFAIGTAIGGLGQASLHQYLCRFYHRLVQNPQRLWDQAPVRLEQHGGLGGICPENCGDAASIS